MLTALAFAAALSGQASDTAIDNAAKSLANASIMMGACEPHTGPGTYREFRSWLVQKSWRAPLAEATDRAYNRAKREFSQNPQDRADTFTADVCSTQIRRLQVQAISDLANAQWDVENPNAVTRIR